MLTVAQVMYDIGMFKTTTRKGSIAEARVAILEKRVKLNGRTVTHTEVKMPNIGTHEITLKKYGWGLTKANVIIDNGQMSFDIGETHG